MNVRKEAFNILNQVLFNNIFSSELLNKLQSNSIFEKKDINFIHSLVYGTIQHKLTFDYISNKYISNKTSFKLMLILEMSLYEKLYFNTPDYAIVNEYVNLVTNAKDKGFINKVLKTIFEDNKFNEIKTKNKKQKICIENSIPVKFFEKIVSQYGIKQGICFATKINQGKKFSYRINTLKINEKDFYDKYNVDNIFKPSEIARNCFITDKNLINSDLREKGLIYLQDECSVLASQILDPKENTKILDMCCAPGGKLTHICALVNNNSYVVGNDINESKKKLVVDNLVRLGANAELIFHDASKIENLFFDYILIDAPCSASGLFRKKPEIRYKDFDKVLNSNENGLLNTQKKILNNANRLLKENGFIVYSTCSIFKEENMQQINTFLQENKNFELIEKHQFLGIEGNNDGFFICKIKKN